jgi:chorismate mutase
MSLDALRAQLDEVDEELIRLLAHRAGIVEEIWAWKASNGVPRIDPARETEMKTRLLADAEALGLKREAVAAIFDRIIGVALK